jgi:hypothetical protein
MIEPKCEGGNRKEGHRSHADLSICDFVRQPPSSLISALHLCQILFCISDMNHPVIPRAVTSSVRPMNSQLAESERAVGCVSLGLRRASSSVVRAALRIAET